MEGNATEFFKANHPMVKVFDFDEEHYLVYDAKANFQFTLRRNDFKVIAGLLSRVSLGGLDTASLSAPEREMLERVRFLQSRGVLLEGAAEKVVDDSDEGIDALIAYYRDSIFMRKFVIEVTERCNMACRYCHNTHEERTRHHSDRQMSDDTAKRSVDFYFRLYSDFFRKVPESHRKKFIKHFPPALGFYGGETVLNWDVMARAICYFESLDWDQFGVEKDKLRVTVNTNLYVLKEEWLDFFVAHQAILFVSLDGPKAENDRNRIDFAGKGTFDRVYRNLMRIKEKDENYYKRNVFILTTDAVNNDRDTVHEFIDSLGLNTIYSDEQPYDGIISEPLRRIDELKNDTPRRTGKALEALIKRFDANPECALDEVGDVTKLCGIATELPERKKDLSVFMSCPLCFDNIMIGTDGSFHLCHKTDGSWPLGNVSDGYDWEKMRQAYKAFTRATNKGACRACWAVNHCYFCAANWLRDGAFCHPRKEDCMHMRAALEQAFEVYVRLYRQKPEILDTLWQQRHDLDHHQGILDINKFIEGDGDTDCCGAE